MADSDVTIQDGLTETASLGIALMIVYRDGIQVVPLRLDEPVTLGRSDPADVQVNSRRLSRVHASFTWDGDRVVVRDHKSTNGTFINGARIDQAELKLDDEASLGSVVVSLHDVGALPQGMHGVERHERFVRSVQFEIDRARTFGRGLAVLLVRSFAARALLARWVPRLHEQVRVVDRMGLFAPDTIEVLLPEADLSDARAFAHRIVSSGGAAEPPLVVGIAAYPQHGASADALCSAAAEAVASASLADPVVSWRMETTGHSIEEIGAPVVRNPAMIEVWRTLDRVADSSISVLIVGETGVGKEIVARGVHERSERRNGPMRCINCGAIPSNLVESVLFGHEKGAFTGADRRQLGVFEEASGGTVLLDEVGELSLAAQVALLRVLESRTINRVGGAEEIAVDVRVLAATHRDLAAMCERGEFRQDLFYRLNTMTVEVPPLRQRVDEIPPLMRRFVVDANRLNGRAIIGLTPEAARLLEIHSWPGNVRELRNAIERAVVIAEGSYITVDDLPHDIRANAPPEDSGLGEPDPTEIPGEGHDPRTLKEAVADLEQILLLGALSACGGNQSKASELLGMSRRTLVYKLARLDSVPADAFRTHPPLRPQFDERGRRMGFSDHVVQLEMSLIRDALARTAGHVGAAAVELGIQKRTLEQKIGKYRLS